MSKYRSKGLVLAMEGDEEEIIVDEVSADELPEATAEVEADVSDANEEMAEIDDLEDSIDDAVEGSDDLEKIQGVMEESVANDGEGLDETAAEIAEIAIESICTRLGIKRKQSIVPAMESFGSKNTRLSATKIAIEAADEQGRSIWKVILDAIKQMMEKAKAFIVALFSKTAALVKAAEAAKAKAKSLAGASLKQEKIENKALAAQIFDGKKSDHSSISAILDNHKKAADAGLKAKDLVLEVAGDIEAFVKNAGGETGKIKDAIGKVIDTYKGLGNSDFSTVNDKGEMVEMIVGPFVGGTAIAIDFNRGEDLSFSMKVRPQVSADKAPESVPALSLDEIGSMADYVIEMAKVTEAYKAQMPKFDAIVKEVGNIANAAINIVSKTSDAEGDAAKAAKAGVAQAKKLVKDISGAVTFFATAVPVGCINSGKAALRYANASLELYEAKKEEKTEEAAA